MSGFPVLSAVVWLPLVTAVLAWFIDGGRRARTLAVAGTVMGLGLTLAVAAGFQTGTRDAQFVEHLALPGISYHLGVDGLSLLFLPLTSIFTLLLLLSPDVSDVRRRTVTVLALQACTLGMFTALDVKLFGVWFILEMWPSWILITLGRGSTQQPSRRTYTAFMTTAAIAFIGAALLAGNGETPLTTQRVVFALFFLAFAVRVPIFPLHSWLPRSVETGNTPGISVFLVGLKPVAFALLRFAIPLAPDAAVEAAPLVGAIGFVGMVYGALVALVQSDLRRMLVFASVSHMGVVLLGLAAMNHAAFSGALLQMLNLGVSITGLFLVAAFLHRRVGSTEFSAMGDFMARAPALTLVFLLIALGGIGLPGTSGFNGEHLIMLGALKAHWALAAGVGLGTLLTAAYLLSGFQRAFLRPRDGDDRVIPDLSRGERLAAGTVCALVMGMGLVSSPFVQVMDESIHAVAERVSAHSAREAWFLPGARRTPTHADD